MVNGWRPHVMQFTQRDLRAISVEHIPPPSPQQRAAIHFHRHSLDGASVLHMVHMDDMQYGSTI